MAKEGQVSDFSLLDCAFNVGSDAVPNWTNTAIQSGGAGGANEIRFCAALQGSIITAANWALYPLPGSVGAVPEAWAINADNGTVVTGYKIPTYGPPSGGIVPSSLVARWEWSQDGTYATSPTFTCYTNSTLTNPSPGTQPPGANNDTITNGSSGDTNSKAYIKANAFGRGVTNTGVQQTPGAGSLTTPVAATDGTNGAVSPGSNAWIGTHWQSLQGGLSYIQNGQVPTWTTHTGNPIITYYHYWAFVLYAGPSMLTAGNQITFLFVYQYTFS